MRFTVDVLCVDKNYSSIPHPFITFTRIATMVTIFSELVCICEQLGAYTLT